MPADNPEMNKESGMRHLAIGWVLVACSTAAMADWVKVAESMDGMASHYVDPATLRRAGAQMQVVTLTDYREAQAISDTQRFRSVKMRDEFNCTDRTGRHLSLVALADAMGTGPVVATEERPAPVRAITPGSADEDMWRHVCGKQ
jgi:hypothetical protein